MKVFPVKVSFEVPTMTFSNEKALSHAEFVQATHTTQGIQVNIVRKLGMNQTCPRLDRTVRAKLDIEPVERTVVDLIRAKRRGGALPEQSS